MNVKLLVSVASAALLIAPAVGAVETEVEKLNAVDSGSALQTRSLVGIAPSPLVVFGVSIFMGTLAVASRELKR